jgi:hypothetical protein
MVFEGADATGFEEDARLTAMWLWTLRTSAGEAEEDAGGEEDAEEEDDETGRKGRSGAFALEYDAARKIAQGLGVHLEQLGSVVNVEGDRAELRRVRDRGAYLFGKEQTGVERRRKKGPQMALPGLEELTEEEGKELIRAGATTLDRLHQSMILFGAGRNEAMRRILVEEGAGTPQFWRLAQALAALYPSGTEERRWVEGVLGRKKSLGL